MVANAGYLRDRTFAKMPISDFEAIIRVHLLGTAYVAHAAWPVMSAQRHGRLVFTTSIAGLYGSFGQANYAAAKLGIIGLLNVLKLEGVKTGIGVDVIAPLAASRLAETVFGPAELARMKPEWVSGVVAFLASDACRSSGLVLEVGAGHLASVRIAENDGVQLPEDAMGDPDAVAVAMERLAEDESLRVFPNGGAAVRKVLGVRS